MSRRKLAAVCIVNMAALCAATTVHSQGNEGALRLVPKVEKRIRQHSQEPPDQPDSAVQEYMRTREIPEEVDPNQAEVEADAAITIPGARTVASALLTKVRYQKSDYLAFGAQILAGSNGEEAAGPRQDSRLFVPEASKYAIGVLGVWNPRSQRRIAREFAVNFGFYYAVKEELAPGPTPGSEPESVEFTALQTHAGVEYILVQRGLSVYLNGHLLSVQQDVANFRRTYGSAAEKTFFYVAPGLKVKFSDKLFVDLEFIVLNDDMKALGQPDDGVMTLLRVGFTQSLHEF